MYAKDTNARIEKRREDSKVSAIGGSSSSSKKTSKTSYQKHKEVKRFDKGKFNAKNKSQVQGKDKCSCCGIDRHPNTGTKFGWKEQFVAKNATCRDCKKIGHFTGMQACWSRKVACIKVELLNSLTPSNTVHFNFVGPDRATEVTAEADAGATITVFKADMIEHLNWLEIAKA